MSESIRVHVVQYGECKKRKAEGRLAAKPKGKPEPRPEVPAAMVEGWHFFLRALWWSGLRLSEALALTWDRPDRFCLDLTGRRPMLRIPGEFQKSGKDELLPLAPEFCELLETVREDQRRGRVFRLALPGSQAAVLRLDTASKVVGRLGKLARVKVHTHPVSGKIKYASAHDCRRAFGERWAARVMPATLMVLMRHADIQTTMRYYVGRNTESAADAAWSAFERLEGTIPGTIGAERDEEGATAETVTPDSERIY